MRIGIDITGIEARYVQATFYRKKFHMVMLVWK